MDFTSFRRRLLRWYDASKRALPWRNTSDPWRVLVSEIMLQQTRVEAVIPYYENFLRRFPDPRALAAASEVEVLAAWSGLGYYSRARNLQQAARAMAQAPLSGYEDIRALPGVGPYTAGAVASIAFGLRHAAVDGNVLRVLARVLNDAGDIGSPQTRNRFTAAAEDLLDRARPGDFNQAMMELGATVCLPRAPLCLTCPVSRNCEARQQNRQNELPVKRPKGTPKSEVLEVAVVYKRDLLLLRQRLSGERRMANFWELPPLADLPRISAEFEGEFRHTIVNTVYTVRVFSGQIVRRPRLNDSFRWISPEELDSLPLTTISRKSLKLTL
jgi:A/G-specific adenine glycosylase